MEIRRLDNQHLLLQIEHDELDALSDPLAADAGNLPTPPPDLAYLTRDSNASGQRAVRPPQSISAPDARASRMAK